MSRIIVATLGSVGDLHPFLAIARAAVRQGHSVLFLSSEPHRAAVESEGVPFEAILSDHDHWRAASHPDLWHPLRGFGVLWRYLAVRSMDAVVDILTREVACSSESVRVLASPLVLGARLACDTLPIRLTTAHTAPSGIRSLANPLYLGSWRVPNWWPTAWRRTAWRALDIWKLEPLGRPAIDSWRQRRGLARAPGAVFGTWLHSPQRVIALFPASFLAPGGDSRLPVQAVGFPLFRSANSAHVDDELAAWLRRPPGRPRLVLYGGSTTAAQAAHFQSAAQALDARGWPVLWIAPGQTPAAVGRFGLRRPWTDLAEVLPACHGWIHHGGIGACAEGLHLGLRPWTLPSAYDQFDNSERLAAHQGLQACEVMLTPDQLRSGALPGLNNLNDWHRRPSMDAQAGEVAVENALAELMNN